MSQNDLKDRIRSVYSSTEEIKDHYSRELKAIGLTEGATVILPTGRTAVCLLPRKQASDTIVTPEDYKEDVVYDYAACMMRDTSELFVVQIPAFGAVPLGGSKYVFSVLTCDIYCYWSMKSIEGFLK